MHQSFATTLPTGREERTGVDLSLCKGQVYPPHCGHINSNFHGNFGLWVLKTLLIHGTPGTILNFDVKTLQLSPAMSPVPVKPSYVPCTAGGGGGGGGFPVTGAVDLSKEQSLTCLVMFQIHKETFLFNLNR